ncbi:MAG TPA: hypothetical protein VLJ15_02920 [Gammaproteobacteria bacterium]|nr:hypothetical protein [Gammaproteobacteria bacterium]
MFKRLPSLKQPGEIEFQSAKVLWTNIKDVFMQPLQTEEEKRAFLAINPIFLEVQKLLHIALMKKHKEATRCYAGILLLNMTQIMKLPKKHPLSFEEMEEYYLKNKIYFVKIKQLLEKSPFTEDVFSAHILSASLLFDRETYCQKLLENWDKLSEINSPFLAYAIIKARELNYSAAHGQKAFQDEKKKMRHPDWQYLFLLQSLLQSEKLLGKLKNYSLEDAEAMLQKIKLPFEPVRCDFFELPLPSEKQVRDMIGYLLLLKATLEIRGNTQTFLPILQQGAPECQEEKTEAPEKLADVTAGNTEKIAPIMIPAVNPPNDERPDSVILPDCTTPHPMSSQYRYRLSG